jgi:hypothetical protein
MHGVVGRIDVQGCQPGSAADALIGSRTSYAKNVMAASPTLRAPNLGARAKWYLMAKRNNGKLCLSLLVSTYQIAVS